MLGTKAKRGTLLASELVIISWPELDRDPEVAVIFGLPTPNALRVPEPLTDASEVSEELQVTVDVTSPVLPSL